MLGELVGGIVGPIFWVWLFTKLATRLGVRPTLAPWAGYVLTLTFGVVASSYTGVSKHVLWYYVVIGIPWTVWLFYRAKRAARRYEPPRHGTARRDGNE